jgi:hypothetical protein
MIASNNRSHNTSSTEIAEDPIVTHNEDKQTSLEHLFSHEPFGTKTLKHEDRTNQNRLVI